MSQYNLEILPNGLIVCSIKISNPFNERDGVLECKALIDTGSELTIVCKSIFDGFTLNNNQIRKEGISTVNNEEDEIITCSLQINLPSRNWSGMITKCYIRDISKRQEYRVIIGMNMLKDTILMYNGIAGQAYIQI